MLKPTPADETPDQQSATAHCLQSLFAAEETPLLRYAFSIVRRRAVAEDIVQEVFLQLHAKWHDVNAPRAWLYRSVRNRALNHLRDHRREVLASAELVNGNNASEHNARGGTARGDTGAEPEDASGETPESVHIRVEATGLLRGKIEELNDEDRQLVELKYFKGMKYRDISRETGLSVSNVGYRLHHILKELATQLRRLGIDDKS